MTLDNSAWRRGSSLFHIRAAQPSRGSLMCVWARATMILSEVVFAARRALSLHTIEIMCVCVCVCWLSGGCCLFFWTGNAILGLLRSDLPPLPVFPFLATMITRGGEGGLAGHRWLAGSLVWIMQPTS
jgi:hypothetical protein